MRLAFIVQRYGIEVNGGAELHCRLLAEHLSRSHQVEIFTTRAKDYIYWENEYPSGQTIENDIPVNRYTVRKKRNLHRFHKVSQLVFTNDHGIRDELQWILENGPYCPKLIKDLNKKSKQFDFFIFYSYRYYPSFHGVKALPHKSILVPTAENDDAINLEIFQELFNLPRGIIYLTPEEKDLVQITSSNNNVPYLILGGGVELPGTINALRFRQKYDIGYRFILYLGRVDRNKGCRELFKFFHRFNHDRKRKLKLVCIGNSVMEELPEDPNIVFLGHLSEEDKFDAISACEILIMPSYLESLSIVVLEAWALGKPVLVNGRCHVLKGQCLRSNGGLYYGNSSEFIECLGVLMQDRNLRGQLGRSGQRYFDKNYRWETLESKTNEFLEKLVVS